MHLYPYSPTIYFALYMTT